MFQKKTTPAVSTMNGTIFHALFPLNCWFQKLDHSICMEDNNHIQNVTH